MNPKQDAVADLDTAQSPMTPREHFVHSLKFIREAWERLLYVRWNPQGFIQLLRLAQTMTEIARTQRDPKLIDLSQQFMQQLHKAAQNTSVPSRLVQDRVDALLNQLHQMLALPDDEPVASVTQLVLSTLAEVFVIGCERTDPLITKLDMAGFRTHCLPHREAVEETLLQRLPFALLVDADLPQEPLGGIALMRDLRAHICIECPILFMATQDDLTARINAVQAGGTFYFRKPVNPAQIIDTLKQLVVMRSAQIQKSVLIIGDDKVVTLDIVKTLQKNGINAKSVPQPLQTLQYIHRIKPNLLLINLSLERTDGLAIIKALGQHDICQTIPITLLVPEQFDHHLDSLTHLDVDLDIFRKPLDTEYLVWRITQRLQRARLLNARLSALSDRDTVSGLYNRQHFTELLERHITTLGISTFLVAVLFIRVNNLHTVRSTVNLTIADEMVNQVAQRIRKVMGPGQLIGRVGESTFAVVVRNMQQADLLVLGRQLQSVVEAEVYDVGDHALIANTCVGISVAVSPTQKALNLLQNADEACRLASQSKGERIHVYYGTVKPSDDEPNENYKRLLPEIQLALQHENMRLVFQPIVSTQLDSVERYEVLLRLYDQKAQLLTTEVVFAIAHQYQLALILDRWVVSHALRHLAKRVQQVKTFLFIKLSADTLADQSLLPWLKAQLAAAQIPANLLVLQVTEATVRNHLKQVIEFSKAIRSLGCGLAIERFSNEADSMTLLKHTEANYAKLAPDFVKGLMRNKAKQQQFEQTLHEIRKIECATIISGIEDIRILPLLWSCGANYLQGFFLQPPHEEMSYDFAVSA